MSCTLVLDFGLLVILVLSLTVLEGTPDGGNAGQPLFLTKHIHAGDVELARNLSLVGTIEGMDVVSYSGFLTVNESYNSNLFFWFFEAMNDSDSAPLVLWLQGGPGSSSMLGLFCLIGPYSVNTQLQLVQNKFTWLKNFNILFIDNPVGTGFSFTQNKRGYARSQQQVSQDLINGLRQFFGLFPEHTTRDFYITGQSYAGKYIPALGHKIHETNREAVVKIRLKGVAIGNGFVDPVTQTDYGDFLYNVGLIDENQMKIIDEEYRQMTSYIDKGQLAEAFAIADELIFDNRRDYNSTREPVSIKKMTAISSYYHLLGAKMPESDYILYVDQPEVRRAIHVGNQTFDNGDLVQNFLSEDFVNSTKPWLEALIDNGYKVMLYSGHLDILIPYVLTSQMIDSMQWKTKANYSSTPRIIWRVDPDDIEVAGFVRPSLNFVEVMVRNAGHIVPFDQPRPTLDLIERFIHDKGWTN